MIVCFSGTGNSRYAAEMFASGLGDELTDAGALMKRGEKAALRSDAPWVFVSPTYAWRIPRVFETFLREGRFDGAREAWFVMTCGDSVGAAAARLEALCRDMGLVFRGLLRVAMPENYLALYPVPGPEEAAAILAAARPVLEAGIESVRQGKPFAPQRPGLAGRLKTAAVNPLFYRFVVRAKPFRVTDACVSCGRCEAACPLNNVRLKDGRPVWGGRCTHCMACISRCPARAIEYGRASEGRERYVCPAFRG